MLTKSETAASIEAAIRVVKATQDTGPGEWRVEDAQDGVILLSYHLVTTGAEGDTAPHPVLHKDSGAVWSVWGGNAILQAAGVETKQAGADGYTDRFGDSIYTEYVTIEYSEPESAEE